MHRHEVAVTGPAFIAWSDGELLAEHFLVDRDQPPAATGQRPEDAEDLRLLPGQDLDHPPAIGGTVLVFVIAGNAQKGAIIDSRCGLARFGAAREGDEDARRGAVIRRIPIGGNGDQLAILVARDDIGEHHGRQHVLAGQALALAIDHAFLLELLEQMLEEDPVTTLDAEGARDFAAADLAGLLLDEGNDLVARGRLARVTPGCLARRPRTRCSAFAGAGGELRVGKKIS